MIQKDRQRQSQYTANADVQRAKDGQVIQCRIPVAQSEQFFVVLKTDQVIAGQHLGIGKRQPTGVGDKAIHEHDDQKEAR